MENVSNNSDLMKALFLLDFDTLFAHEDFIRLLENKEVQDILFRAQGKTSLNKKSVGSPAQKSSQPQNSNTEDYTGQLRNLQQKLLGNEDIMQKILSLQDDPALQKILQNPELMNAIQSFDFETLLANPDFQELLQNPTVQDIIEETK